jgi:hypothetical protein
MLSPLRHESSSRRSPPEPPSCCREQRRDSRDELLLLRAGAQPNSLPSELSYRERRSAVRLGVLGAEHDNEVGWELEADVDLPHQWRPTTPHALLLYSWLTLVAGSGSLTSCVSSGLEISHTPKCKSYMRGSCTFR